MQQINWTPEQTAAVVTAVATLIAALAAVVSAVFAWIAVRSQRRDRLPHLKVSHSMLLPVFGGQPRTLAGSKLSDPWFVITAHNDSLMPATVQSAGLAFGNSGSAPFIQPPRPGLDTLPKTIAPGDEANFYLDELSKIAQAHVEHGGARWVTVKIGGGVEFRSEPIDKTWLDG